MPHGEVRSLRDWLDQGAEDCERHLWGRQAQVALGALAHALAVRQKHSVHTVPIGGRRRDQRRTLAWPVLPPLEAMVGVDDQRRSILVGAANPVVKTLGTAPAPWMMLRKP